VLVRVAEALGQQEITFYGFMRRARCHRMLGSLSPSGLEEAAYMWLRVGSNPELMCVRRVALCVCVCVCLSLHVLVL